MPLVRKASQLLSREIRKTATGGQILRKLDNKAPIDKNAVWDWIKGAVGWASESLLKAVTGVFTFKFSDLWQRIVSEFMTIYNWDFNVTDEALEQRVKALNKQIKVTIAGQVGRAIGTVIAAGIGIGGAFAINAQMGMYLLQDAGTEIVQDWVSEVSGAILQIKNIEQQKAVIRRFQNYRRLMKLIYRIPGVAQLFGADPAAIQQWGIEKREPWSFAKQVNKFVQSLPGDWADAAEELLEEMGEAIVETGFIIAGSLDSFFFDEALRDTPGQINGEERTIALIPNRDNPSERVILSGREEQLKSSVTQTLATVELLNNRDMGTAIIDETGEDIPILKSDGLLVVVTLYNYDAPPYWTKERRVKLVKSEIKLPNFKRSKLSWETVKQTFGNNVVLTKGSIEAVANLSNGRKIVAWVSSENEGEKLLDKLVPLVDADPIYPYEFNKRKGKGKDKNIDFRKQTPMYLSSMTIINYDKLTKYETFKLSLPPDSKIPFKDPKREKVKIALYHEQKPKYIDEQIRKILSNSLDENN